MAFAQVVQMDDHRASQPRLEDGFVGIANELFDALLRFPFTLKQQRVVLAVIRKTYGHGKQADDLSAAQLGAICGMARNHVTETLNELQRMNVITKTAGEYGCLIGINKRHSEWESEAKKAAPPSATPESGAVLLSHRRSPERGLR